MKCRRPRPVLVVCQDKAEEFRLQCADPAIVAERKRLVAFFRKTNLNLKTDNYSGGDTHGNDFKC